MSERLSSVEIEDVLSSIRRLVSEDLRPGAKPAEAAAPAPAAPSPVADVGKLVLTPAHRIKDEAEPPVGGFSSVRARGAAPVYDEDAELPAEPAPAGHDWFDFAAPDAAPEDARAGEAVAPMAEMAEPEPMDAEVTGWTAPDVAAEPDDVLAGPVAQDEGADWLPEDEPVAVSVAEEAVMPDLQQPEEAVATGAAVADEDWADAAEAEIRRELEAEAEASVFTRFDAAEEMGAAGEPVFDEEMLRDLVRDIIREELQGALGERITRNVRKLVRAEIARALAVRDFE